MKPIILTEPEWDKLRRHLVQTQPKSVMMMRWKMLEVLGFTDRKHTVWVAQPGTVYQRREVHLDFYNEAKRTFFLLKYGDYIVPKDSID